MALFYAFLFALLAPLMSASPAKRPPNIIYILADDLGYGELGAYGQQIIETPNIDRLAAEGLRFTQHYTGSPVCAPARCILLTGRHSGHAYIRGNDEMGSRGDVWNYRAMFANPGLEGQRPIPDSVVTLAEVLRGAGYRTAVVGKWGLGYPGSEGAPNRQGFDLFFGYNCQRQAHTYYPLHLWRNDRRVMLANDTVAPGTKLPPGADPADPASYAAFNQADYAPDRMLREAQSFIRRHRRRPFFLYYATPLPHLALQAPARWVDHYRARLGPEPLYTGETGYFPCHAPRATYAAMISCFDEQVGALLQTLRELGLDDNTLVLLSSDNGPTFVKEQVDAAFFNSAGPFGEDPGRVKGTVYEGGVRVPMIARWPGRIAAGGQTDLPSVHYDIFPTLCELAGIPAPAGLDGVSFAPTLLGRPAQQARHEYLYWEFPERGGQQAVRLGDWKGVRQRMHDGNLTIELYNLAGDPAEQHDVATQHPDVVARIGAIMKKEHRPSAVERFRLRAID